MIYDREQRKQHTQNAILDSAIKMFSKVGFDAASLGEIGKRCNIKKSLVQYHFETKDKLWKASVDRLWKQLRASYPKEALQPDSTMDLESIREILKKVVYFAKNNPSWIGIMFREASNPSPRLDWLIDHYLKKDFADATLFVSAAQKYGLLPKAPPIYLLHIIFGSLSYSLFVAPLTEKVTGIDMTTTSALDMLVDTLMQMLSMHTTIANHNDTFLHNNP